MDRKDLENLEVTINTSLTVFRPFYTLYGNNIRELEKLNKDEAVEYLQQLFFELYKSHSITVNENFDNVGISIKFKDKNNEN